MSQLQNDLSKRLACRYDTICLFLFECIAKLLTFETGDWMSPLSATAYKT